MKIFAQMAKMGAGLQEHQILLQMSIRLKELTNKHKLFLMTATQLNNNYKDQDDNMDDSSLSGSKAIAQKVDVGALLLAVSRKDEEIINTFMMGENGNEGIFGSIPNVSLNIYKSRGNKWKMIRIWLKFSHGTLHCEDICVTDYKGNLIPNIKPLHVVFDEMEEVSVAELPFDPTDNPDLIEAEQDSLPDSFNITPEPTSQGNFNF